MPIAPLKHLFINIFNWAIFRNNLNRRKMKIGKRLNVHQGRVEQLNQLQDKRLYQILYLGIDTKMMNIMEYSHLQKDVSLCRRRNGSALI
ncbi:MAG: hypothetical protein EZS28_048366 [Streblomastix strix]|uniref:Uncharacterized protein n=1 Tax=Streblomastix strix TaxID=222440 RepID=A0A5J4TD38_9EUKA|nr:MAG: hypothetical protein EZS28_048366 [Streblomastix strix]